MGGGGAALEATHAMHGQQRILMRKLVMHATHASSNASRAEIALGLFCLRATKVLCLARPHPEILLEGTPTAASLDAGLHCQMREKQTKRTLITSHLVPANGRVTAPGMRAVSKTSGSCSMLTS